MFENPTVNLSALCHSFTKVLCCVQLKHSRVFM